MISKKIIHFIITFIITTFAINAQQSDVLFTINEEPVYVSEFVRVYNKNLDLVKDESQKEIDSYLKLFVNYKLKLAEAKSLGLDKEPKYIKEFEGYKKQLSKNYLTETKVTDALVEEAYNRLKQEVNARHVLIRLNENATPKDTLEAYNKLVALRDRIFKEGYKAIQKEVHDGKTIYAEDLGYFTAFKMVYPFETETYKTEKGDISMPFKTRFGYHIVEVVDKRKSRGKITVAHIMLKDENKIKDIYKRLQQGETFGALAKQFSEDQSTANKEGVLRPFSSGELSSPEFENNAFALKEKNNYSKPFKTQHGWHIIKLIEKQLLASFSEMKPQLENKIKRDSRAQVINESRLKTLKGKYKVKKQPETLNYFKSIISNDYQKGKWIIPKDLKTNEIAFTIQNKPYTYQDFANFLVKQQRQGKNKTLNLLVEKKLETFINTQLLKYQEDNLINENQEFAQIVQEYQDGLLLFDLMEKKVWNVEKTDSLVIKEYYNKNKSKYFFNQRVDAIVASSAKKSDIKKVAKLLSQNKTVKEIKEKINTNQKVKVTFTEEEMNANHQALPKAFSFTKGVSKTYKHNDAYVVVKVNKILPKKQKTYQEAKGKVLSDFQENKEKQWLKTLQSKYTVSINQDVLKKIKKQIKNK